MIFVSNQMFFFSENDGCFCKFTIKKVVLDPNKQVGSCHGTFHTTCRQGWSLVALAHTHVQRGVPENA